jgi:hypothetical protein
MECGSEASAPTSAISSRREHTPQALHSPKTPAKHHQHRHKHTPTLTTETHTTNATPHLHPNTTPHRHFSALHPHTPHHPITRHLFPHSTPHTARSTTHPEQSTAHDPDTRPIHPRTPRSPLSTPQHGFSPSPNPLFIQRNPTSTSQRCHTFNNNTFNDTGNCHPSVPSETACTQNAISARDLPCLVRLECPRTIITKNTRAPHPTRRHGPSTFTRKCTSRPRTTSDTRCHPVRCCHFSLGVHTWSLYTRRRPRPEGAPCGKSHQRESLRVRTQQTVFGNSNLPNALVSPRPSPTHSSSCSGRPAALSHARTRCRLAIQPAISERREAGLA